MELSLSWRNIWRNPRRTAVILIAVSMGVWSMVFMGGLMRGMATGMVQNSIATLTGHIQIQHPKYPDDPSVDYRISPTPSLIRRLTDRLPPHSLWAPRIRVDAVLNNARHSTGVTIVGIDPVREARVSFIGRSVTKGAYLKPGDEQGILIGRALANQFETTIGHKLILMSQDADGEVTSRAFIIRGIFQAEMQSTEKTYVFVDLAASQKMLRVGDEISEIVVLLPNYQSARDVTRRLQSEFAADRLSIRSWQQIHPLLMVNLDIYQTFTFIWYLVVFVAMGFGVVNTTLMAVFERMHEFGLLKALGMRPIRIIKNIMIESALILLIGMICGTLLGLASCWALSFTGIDLSAFAKGTEYFGITRIIYPEIVGIDVFSANAVVLLLGLLISLYPAVKAARFLPVEAMSHT
jgi:ABC-type lipoprotein release transport system permease subunit